MLKDDLLEGHPYAGLKLYSEIIKSCKLGDTVVNVSP